MVIFIVKTEEHETILNMIKTVRNAELNDKTMKIEKSKTRCEKKSRMIYKKLRMIWIRDIQ